MALRCALSVWRCAPADRGSRPVGEAIFTRRSRHASLRTMNTAQMNVAFLGLGAIGFPMAKRVADAGFSLAVWNRTEARARDFARATGCRVAPTPAEAAR